MLLAGPQGSSLLSRHPMVKPMRYAPLALCWLFVSFATGQAWAQLPTARLTRIFPAGGQQGSTVELSIAGSDLEEATKLLFSHEGITAEPKVKPPTAFRKEAQPIPGQFTVKIAPEVTPGIYECRAVGLYGVSNPRAFVVGDLPEVVETGNNNSLATPMEVEVGTTINGRTGNDSFDTFRFEGAKGQRLLIECASHRIDSRTDSTLALFTVDGKQIAFARDSNRFDPLLDFTVPADGPYVLKVYDFTYRGGDDYVYRLTISTKPYIDFVFPPAGQPGTKASYTLFGRNLPGGAPSEMVTASGAPLEKLQVEVQLPQNAPQRREALGSFAEPRDVAVDGFEYRLESPQGASNPVLISFATAPLVNEQEPNDDTEKAQALSLPCEVVGQFYPERDSDWYQFEAAKGDVYWMEVFSQRLGLPTDPVLLVQKVTKNDQGEVSISDVKEVDDHDPKFGNPVFDRPTTDVLYRFAAPEDATYRVLVRDLYGGNGARPEHVYRFSIRPETPDFRLVATLRWLHETDKNKLLTWHPVLRQGGKVAIEVQAYLRDGFNEPIRLEAAGLPAGVTCPPVTLSPGEKKGVLILSASEDAASWSGTIQVIGKAQLEDKEIVRQACGSCVIWSKSNQNEYTFARMTRDIALAVIEEKAPLRVNWGGDTHVQTARAGKVEIDLKVAGEKGIKGDLKLAPQGLPKEIKAGAVTVKGSSGDGKLTLTVDPKIKPDSYTFFLTGTTKFAFSRNPAAAERAAQAKKDIDEAVKQLTEAQKQADAALKEAQTAVAEAKKALAGAKDEAAKGEATKKQQEAETAQAKAAEAAKQAAADLKAAQDEQKRLAKEASDLEKAAKPKDIDVYVETLPIELEVLPAPVKLAELKAPAAIKQGEKLELPVNLERLLGYDEPVEITLELPKNVKAVSAPKVTVDKGKSSATLTVQAQYKATTGNHQSTIKATLKYNGQSLTVTEPVQIKIEAVPEEKKDKK